MSSRNSDTRAAFVARLVVVVLALVGAGALAKSSALDRVGLARGLTAAKSAIDRGAPAEALSALTPVVEALRAEAPLSVRRVVVVDEPPKGHLKFTPSAGGVVKGRTVLLYVEVEHAKTRAGAGGTREVALDVTGAFRFDGEDIGERALGVHTDAWREEPGVIAFGLDFALSEKAPAGRYTLTLHIGDVVGGKKASGEATFELR